MKCISETRIKVKGTFVDVPCGKCNFCLQTRRADWCFRLYEERKISHNSFFLTLTIDDANLTFANELPILEPKDLQAFNKAMGRRVRENTKGKWKYRYYSTGEYGTQSGRPHYHAIMFNVDKQTVEDLANKKIWKKGFITLGHVTPASIAYVTKYCIDRDDMPEEYKEFKPFSHMSRNPGLGINYLEKNRKRHLYNHGNPKKTIQHVVFQGLRAKMPRYYRKKMKFSDYEAATLAIYSKQETEKREAYEREQLKYFCKDVDKYIEEKRKLQYEKIRIKSLKLNSL